MQSIDVVVSTYNSEKYLRRCIKSILNQDYANVRILVQDGDSSDDTIDIIRFYEENIYYWDSEPDTGIYNAWNKALKYSRSDWVIFIGADDYLWEPKSFSMMVPHLRNAFPTHNVVYGRVNRVYPDGRVIQTDGREWAWARQQFKDRMAIPHQGVFHHQTLFAKNGLFDEEYSIVGDHELLLRELQDHKPLFVPSVIVTGMQIGGVSQQTEHAVDRWIEYRKSQKKHDISGFRWRWWWGYVRAKLRLYIEKIFGKQVANVMADNYRRLVGLPAFWADK